MDFKMLNEEYGFVSAGYEEFEGLGLDRTTIFHYDYDRDLIVFNEDHPDTPGFVETLPEFFQLTKKEKERFYQALSEEGFDWVVDCLKTADKIQHIRQARKDVRTACAMPIPVREFDPYFDEVKKRIGSEDCGSYWGASLFYLLGKAHGIRQERARRRRKEENGMNSQVVFSDRKTGRTSPVYSPAPRFKGGAIRWYEDRPKGGRNHDKNKSLV